MPKFYGMKYMMYYYYIYDVVYNDVLLLLFKISLSIDPVRVDWILNLVLL